MCMVNSCLTMALFGVIKQAFMDVDLEWLLSMKLEGIKGAGPICHQVNFQPCNS